MVRHIFLLGHCGYKLRETPHYTKNKMKSSHTLALKYDCTNLKPEFDQKTAPPSYKAIARGGGKLGDTAVYTVHLQEERTDSYL